MKIPKETEEWLDLESRKSDAAVRILVLAGVMAYCPEHEEETYLVDGGDIEDSYTLANELVSYLDPSVEVFDGNESELVRLLEGIVDEAPSMCEECHPEYDRELG